MKFDPIEAAKRDAISDPDFVAMMNDHYDQRQDLQHHAMSYGYTKQQVKRASDQRLADWAAGRKSKARYL